MVGMGFFQPWHHLLCAPLDQHRQHTYIHTLDCGPLGYFSHLHLSALCLCSQKKPVWGRWIVSLAGAGGGEQHHSRLLMHSLSPSSGSAPLSPTHSAHNTLFTIILIYWTMIFRVPYRPPESDLVAVMALNTMSLWRHQATFCKGENQTSEELNYLWDFW